jgi:hypothetical protein
MEFIIDSTNLSDVVSPSESFKKHTISSHYDVASQLNIDGNAFLISDNHFKKCKIFFPANISKSEKVIKR